MNDTTTAWSRTLATTDAYAYRREVPAFFPRRSSLNGGSSGPEMQVFKD